MKRKKKRKNKGLLPLVLLASTTLSVPGRIAAGSAQLWQRLAKRKCKIKKLFSWFSFLKEPQCLILFCHLEACVFLPSERLSLC